MKAKSLLGVVWGEAVLTTVYLLNRSSCKAIGGRTPYELWNGHTPSVQHLRTFGCIAHMKVNTPHLRKLDDRSRRTVFVGYEPGSNAYRVYDPLARRVHISRDVTFDEAATWTWPGAEPNDFTVEELDQEDPSVIITTRTTTEVPPVSSSASPAPSGASASPASSAPMAGSPTIHHNSPAPGSTAHPQVEFASPPGAGMEDYLDADHDGDAPLRFCRVDSMLGEADSPTATWRSACCWRATPSRPPSTRQRATSVGATPCSTR